MSPVSLIESGLPVVDAHHHFWDLDRNYHPWLCDLPMIPFRYGDYSAIKRNYLPEHFRADVGEINLIDSVYVEAEWRRDDPIGETRWVSALHDEENLPSAIVAQAWLDDPASPSLLAQQAAFPLVRSVRHKPEGAASVDEFNAGKRSSMQHLAWRRGFAHLAKHGLHFDLQTPYWHLPEARALAGEFPETTIVLNHTGLPADRSAQGLAEWRQAMAILAEAPNVVVKISGLGVPGMRWTTAAVRDIVNDTIDLFGSERCMFASNFPVDALCAGYGEIFESFYESVLQRSDTERHDLFSGTATRVYRL